jgi:hypothetical protein
MKQRIVSVLLAAILCVSMLGGCAGSNTNSTADGSTADDNSISGQINKIDGSKITLETSDGETQTITVTDDTEILRQTGGPGEMPEKPDGDEAGNGEAPGNADGNDSGNGEAPEKPDGNDSGSGEAPEKPDGDDSGSGEAPEKPDGDNSGNGEAPEKPDGDDSGSGEASEKSNGDSSDNTEGNGNGEAPEKPDGNDGGNGENSQDGGGKDFDGQTETTESITLDDLSEGDQIRVTLADDGNAEKIVVMNMGNGMGDGGMTQGVDSYDSVTEYTEDTDVSGESFSSTGTDENAIHVFKGADVKLTDIDVSRKSSDSKGGDNSSFYGVGAAVLTTEGTTHISDSKIETDAAGGAGVFAYGDGTVYVSDTTIKTKKDTSGGIHAAGGGTLYVWNLNVETAGESSAAIRSDRGGGTIVANGGTYVSNGTGSPAVYSTADITVNQADLTANGSEAVCIEGLNSLRLFDSNLTGNMSDDKQNDCTWNVILYQSMSGDSEEGNSTFEMNGGTLTAKNGGMFYTTNTESTFTLSDVDITYADENEFFLRCTGNNNERGWGTSGKNGADCLFTAINQEMKGDIIWDSISNLDFYMTDGSTLTGAITDDESYAGDGGDGYCNLYIAKGCTWTVTGDSTLSTLQCAGKIVDSDGKTVTIQDGNGKTYVKGDSEYTVTVSSYEKTADLSGASKATSWSDYEVEKK